MARAAYSPQRMPIEMGRPFCRAVSPSAPSELAWLLNLLTQTAPYAKPALDELDRSLLPGIPRLRDPVGARFRRLWTEDSLAGCPELLPVAYAAGSVLDGDLVKLLVWLSAEGDTAVREYELLSEPAKDRLAIRARVRRLGENGALRRAYRELLEDVWQVASDAWERQGRANVLRACVEWQARLDSGTAIEELVPPRHPLTRAEQLGFEGLLTHRMDFALSPLHFCMSGGHVADLGDFVHVAVPASDLNPIRRVRDAAFVADRLRVLAEPTRVHILIQLLSAPAGVMEVARVLRISQPTVSGHIKILRSAGLIQPRRLGARTVFMASRKLVERLLEDARGTLARWD
jgi:DNA-binding transcriptional ArsR family regulator